MAGKEEVWSPNNNKKPQLDGSISSTNSSSTSITRISISVDFSCFVYSLSLFVEEPTKFSPFMCLSCQRLWALWSISKIAVVVVVNGILGVSVVAVINVVFDIFIDMFSVVVVIVVVVDVVIVVVVVVVVVNIFFWKYSFWNSFSQKNPNCSPRLIHNQCDQICRKFATLLKVTRYWEIIYLLLGIIFNPNLLCCWANNFPCCKWPKMNKKPFDHLVTLKSQ